MAKTRKKPAPPAAKPLRVAAKSRARFDGWQSIHSGMGTSRDKREGISFQAGYDLDQYTLAALYKQSDMVARVVDIFPHEMLREWVSFPTDKRGALVAELKKLKARTRIKEALTWSRLDGGAVVVMGINDGRRIDRPLDEAKIRDITYLTVFDRWEIYVTAYVLDPLSPNYGEPEMYEIVAPYAQGRSVTPRIHASRVLRFDGQLAKREDRRMNLGWSAGVVDRVYPVLRDFIAAYEGMAVVLQEGPQAVFKMDGLADKLDADEDGLVVQRLKEMDLARGAFRAIPLDAEHEDFSRSSINAAGMSDLLDKMGVRVSAATGIPLPLLLGQSPGGLQSTGAHEEANFYNVVKAMQVEHLDEPYSRLFRIVAKAKGLTDVLDAQLEVPFEHRPLWQPSELETAKTHQAQAEADDKYIQNGTLKPHEVATSRFKASQYSLDTALDPSIGDAARELAKPPAPAAGSPTEVATKPPVG